MIRPHTLARLNGARALAKFREATAEDYAAFARFFTELKAPEPVPSERVYESLLVPRAFFAVESEVPSAILCWRPEGDVLHVSMVAVLPERRRQGLGRQLMLEAARRGRAQGFRRWQLNVAVDNAAAQALYAQLGMAAAFETVLLEADVAIAMRHTAIRADSFSVVGRFGEPPPPMDGSVSPVRVVVHGDAALVDELCAAGGVVVHRTLRMSGEMPAAT